VHLGGIRVLLHTVTMDAEQGVDFLTRVQPRQAVPVLYDDYRVFRSPLSAFLELAERQRLTTSILLPVARGDVVTIGDGAGA
jgi:hypothetical protein